MLPATYVCMTFFPYLNLSNIATAFGRKKLGQFSYLFSAKLILSFNALCFPCRNIFLCKKLSNERKSRRPSFTIFFHSYVIYASRINKLINSKYLPRFVFEFLTSCAPRKNHVRTFSYISDIPKLLCD